MAPIFAMVRLLTSCKGPATGSRDYTPVSKGPRPGLFGVGVYDQVKSAFQDIIAPELHALRGEMRVMNEKITALDEKIGHVESRLFDKIVDIDIRLSTKVDSLRAEMMSMKSELISEIRRLDTRIDGIDRELHTAIDIRERLAALEARRSS